MAFDAIWEVCDFPPNLCDPGFTWDPSSKLCFIVLNSTRNYWTSAEACLDVGSELLAFDNDKQVGGFLALLKNGKFILFNFVSTNTLLYNCYQTLPT